MSAMRACLRTAANHVYQPARRDRAVRGLCSFTWSAGDLVSWIDDYRRHRDALLAGTIPSNTPASIIGNGDIIGDGKPWGFYCGCYRNPDGTRGAEIWLPWF